MATNVNLFQLNRYVESARCGRLISARSFFLRKKKKFVRPYLAIFSNFSTHFQSRLSTDDTIDEQSLRPIHRNIHQNGVLARQQIPDLVTNSPSTQKRSEKSTQLSPNIEGKDDLVKMQFFENLKSSTSNFLQLSNLQKHLSDKNTLRGEFDTIPRKRVTAGVSTALKAMHVHRNRYRLDKQHKVYQIEVTFKFI
jgi:hypothetical protein